MKRILALIVLLGAMPACAQQYKLVAEWKIGGDGFWDYMTADPAAHLLYASHGPRVEVIDTTTGKAAGAITGLKGTHGIALDPEGKFGYVTDGGSNAVAVFDRKTFAVVATIPVCTGPDGIAFEPVTSTVWAFCGRSQNVAVVDTKSRSVTATIALPGRPEFPQADGKGNVLDNIESKNEVVKLDAHALKLVATWPLTDCESPSGSAMDTVHQRFFAVCDGKKMAVLDAETGKQLASPDIGDGPDAAGYSEKYQLAFSPNGQSGTVSVVDAGHGYKTIQTVTTQKGARTMAYDPATDRMYLADADRGPAAAATKDNPRPRPTILPDTFRILVVGRQ